MGEGGRDLRGVCLGQMGGSENDSVQEQKGIKQRLPGLLLQHTSLFFFSLLLLLLYVQPDITEKTS